MSAIPRTRFMALAAALAVLLAAGGRLGADRQAGGPDVPYRGRRADLRHCVQERRGAGGPRHQRRHPAGALQQLSGLPAARSISWCTTSRAAAPSR